MLAHLKYLVLASIPAIFFAIGACNKEDDEDQKRAEEERKLIEQYVHDNNLNGQFTESGLYYLIVKSGSDDHPNAASRITVKYKGYYLSGEVFEEAEILLEYLGNFIPGWIEGVPLIGEDGEILLIIPSHLAYGEQEPTVRIFEIKLFNFVK